MKDRVTRRAPGVATERASDASRDFIGRRSPTGAIDRLFAEPHSFSFFQAVRLLSRWIARDEGLSSAEVIARRLAFRNSLELSFPPSEIAVFNVIAAFDPDAPPKPGLLDEVVEASTDPHAPIAHVERHSREVERIEMTPAFMGLLGSNGTLPIYYTELFARRELFERDQAPRAFLDIFLQRAVALFYEAWRKHRLPVRFEDDRKNEYLPLILSVAGLGHKGLRDRLRSREGGVADDTLAYFAGGLQQRPVSAAMLQRLLAQYFAAPVALEQFVGRWFTLPVDNQSAMGLANMSLGRDAVVGERIWQRDLRMRLTIGPLNAVRFRRFLPGGAAALALRELLALLTGTTLEYEVRLCLRATDVQGAALDVQSAPRLGWDSFLVTQSESRDRDDPGYDVFATA